MNAYEVFIAACNVALIVAAARILWLISESQLNCEEYLKEIAEGVERSRGEPWQRPADGSADDAL